MAISASTVIEVRTGGSDTNGGGYVSGGGGTDWTLQSTAQYSVTDGVTAGTTTITSATAAFGTDVVGNLIYVSGGTGSVVAGWYQIMSRTNATTIVVDRSTGLTSGTGVILKIGGALASPGQAGAIRVLGNTIFVKYSATSYTIASTSANAATGTLDIQTGSDSVPDYVIGYDTTRTIQNTDANRPTLQVAASGVTGVSVVKVTGAGTVANATIRNIIVDGQSKTTIRGFEATATNGDAKFERCAGNNCTNVGFSATLNASLKLCSTTGCSTQPSFSLGGGMIFGCVAKANSAAGFAGTGALMAGPEFIRCIADSNTGATTDGFINVAGQTLCRFVQCDSYNNGRDGFRYASTNARGTESIDCIAYGNSGWGFNNSGGSPIVNCNCAGGSNTSGNESAITQSYGFITLSASPFTNAASSDFSLNSTAGGGASLRAAGFLSAFPGGTTSSYPDIGAAQHQDAGGSTTYVINSIINRYQYEDGGL